MEGSSVPKFGSFKPKVKQDSKHDSERLQSSDVINYNGRVDGRPSSERKIGRHRRDTSNHRGLDLKHNQRNRSAHRSGLQFKEQRRRSLEVSQHAATDEFEESSHFIVDRRGDAKNVVYGSLHRYSVPAYRRTGYGNVVGLSSQSKIDREASDEKGVTIATSTHHAASREKVPRLLSSKYGRSNETKVRFVTAQASSIGLDHEREFIEIEGSRKRKRAGGNHSEGSDDEQGKDYRSIEGKAKTPKAPDDDDVEIVDSDDSFNDDLGLHARQENSVLSKTAKANPTSLSAWVSLADHQKNLVRPGFDISMMTNSERRTLAELRLSIYSDASKHILKGHSQREHLISVIIQEGRLIWDKTKLASRWKEALIECPASISLWIKYLDYVQDEHSLYRYEACKLAYLECFKILQEAYETSSKETKKDVNQIQIYVLLRFTLFVREAGYDELAIAVWQALLELYFLAPSALSSAKASDRLEALEEFWESEVARIGEEGSLGWATYYDLGEGAQRKSHSPITRNSSASTPLQGFVTLEEVYSRIFSLPASTSDDDAVTDPFRCVMFSDMSDAIKPLSSDLPPLALIESFAHFMGLPPVSLHRESNHACDWQQDPHLAHGRARAGSVSTALRPEDAMISCQHELISSFFDHAFDDFKIRVEQSTLPESCVRFVDRALGAILATDYSNEILAEYYLAFKAKLLPKEMVKSAKRILKQQPSSMRLYNAYALAEASMGELGKALEIWSAALSMTTSLQFEKQDDVLYLWHSRLLAQLNSGDDEGGLRLLLTMADSADDGFTTTASEEPAHHIRHLRAQRRLEAMFDRTRLVGHLEHSILCANLLAWLSYLTMNHDINAALQVYSKYIDKNAKERGSLAMEELHQCKGRLIRTHVEQRRPYKPSLLQQELEDSLERFPSNSFLLELHSTIAAQDRIRMLVHAQKVKDVTKAPSIVQWSFKIADEIRRNTHETSGSTSNTVRAAFSKALLQSDSSVSHSPALWTAWLRFEFGIVGSEREVKATQRAKSVFLDGLRYLPWSKVWIIQGMRLLGDEALSSNEMRQVYEVLNEKGLRIRVDMEQSL